MLDLSRPFAVNAGSIAGMGFVAPKKAQPKVKETGEATVRLIGANFDFGADPEWANEEISLMPGRFAVEMCPLPEVSTNSGLVLVMRDRNLYRPDAGIIIAASPWESIDRYSANRKAWDSPLGLGQAVIVDHEPGHRLDAAVFGNYEAASEVRIYGSAVFNKGYAVPWPRSKSILMIESSTGLLIIGKRRFVPDSQWVLVARDSVVEKSVGGILLPDSAKFGGLKGTVIDAGYRAYGASTDSEGKSQPIPRGTRVLYVANLTKKNFRDIFAEGEDTDRLCLLHIDAIQGELNESVPEDYLNRMIAASESIVV